MTKTVQVRYFAILREQSGQSSETVSTDVATALELYQELAKRHSFTLPAEQIRLAVDNRYEPLDLPLSEGQILAFIPPVAGG